MSLTFVAPLAGSLHRPTSLELREPRRHSVTRVFYRVSDDELASLRAEIDRLRAQEEELRTRARKAEDELRAARALHAATIESLPFDFWARDREGYCFSQNATARANWGELLHKRPRTWTSRRRSSTHGCRTIGAPSPARS